uniref:RNase H type-1 domain-containing protein n=1 Tax=Chaetoceros debilis TaxID=122233 RepID=A0A7S3VAX5_9STRA
MIPSGRIRVAAVFTMSLLSMLKRSSVKMTSAYAHAYVYAYAYAPSSRPISTISSPCFGLLATTCANPTSACTARPRHSFQYHNYGRMAIRSLQSSSSSEINNVSSSPQSQSQSPSPSLSPLQNRTQVRKMRVAELRDEMQRLGLKTSGLRTELVNRLIDHLFGDNPSNPRVKMNSKSNLKPIATTCNNGDDDNSDDDDDDDDDTRSTTQTRSREYDIIEPSKQYVLRYAGHTKPLDATAACGLVLYDTITNRKVWEGTTYFNNAETTSLAELVSVRRALLLLTGRHGLKNVIIQGHATSATLQQLQGTFQIGSKNKVVGKYNAKDVYDHTCQLMADMEYCEVWGIALDQLGLPSYLAKNTLKCRKSFGFKEMQNINFDFGSSAKEEDGGSDGDGDDGNESSNITEFDDLKELDADGNYHQDVHVEMPDPPGQNYDLEAMAARHEQTQPNMEEIKYKNESVPMIKSLPALSPDKKYILHFDGGSRGNPGVAGSGMVIFDYESGLEVWSAYKYLEEETTNNVAEYEGLLTGLRIAYGLGVRNIIAEGDSTLVVKQVKGEYKVKMDHLKVLREEVVQVLKGYESYRLNYLPRADNFRADQLANVAMDQRASAGLEVLDVSEDQSVRPHVEIIPTKNDKAVQPISPSDAKGSITRSTQHSEQPIIFNSIPTPNLSQVMLSNFRKYTLRFSGGSKGIGKAGSGATLIDTIAEERLWDGMHFMDEESVTQNVAVYVALIIGLQKASAMGATRLICESSHELVVKQMNGLYKVKSKELKKYHAYAGLLCENFETVDFEFISGEENREAKVLYVTAIQQQMSNLNS